MDDPGPRTLELFPFGTLYTSGYEQLQVVRLIIADQFVNILPLILHLHDGNLTMAAESSGFLKLHIRTLCYSEL